MKNVLRGIWALCFLLIASNAFAEPCPSFEFSSDHEWEINPDVTGEGTQENPYVIENCEFETTSSSGPAISVQNCSVYFVIQNIEIIHGPTTDAAISLLQTPHAVVRDVSIKTESNWDSAILVDIEKAPGVQLENIEIIHENGVDASVRVIEAPYAILNNILVHVKEDAEHGTSLEVRDSTGIHLDGIEIYRGISEDDDIILSNSSLAHLENVFINTTDNSEHGTSIDVENSNDISLENITIYDNSYGSESHPDGEIYLRNSSNAILYSIYITGSVYPFNDDYNIRIENSDFTKISWVNIISNSDSGIEIINSLDVGVDSSLIYSESNIADHGVFTDSDYTTVHSSTIISKANRFVGIYTSGRYLTVSFVVAESLDGNGEAIVSENDSTSVEYSEFVGWDHGIVFSSFGEVTNSRFEDCGIGVQVNGNYNDITSNDFNSSSVHAVEIIDGSEGTEVTGNNFRNPEPGIEHVLDMGDESLFYDEASTPCDLGNYWSGFCFFGETYSCSDEILFCFDKDDDSFMIYVVPSSGAKDKYPSYEPISIPKPPYPPGQPFSHP